MPTVTGSPWEKAMVRSATLSRRSEALDERREGERCRHSGPTPIRMERASVRRRPQREHLVLGTDSLELGERLTEESGEFEGIPLSLVDGGEGCLPILLLLVTVETIEGIGEGDEQAGEELGTEHESDQDGVHWATAGWGWSSSFWYFS